MQPRPLSAALAPEQVRRSCLDLVDQAGVRQVLVAGHSGVPEVPRAHSAMTHVPFLMLCLEGCFDAQIMEAAGMRPLELPAGSAIWYPADRWVDVYHHRCPQYLRITFDIDHSLFGLKDQRRQTPAHDRKELGTVAIAGPRPPLVEALIARLDQSSGLSPTHRSSLLSALLAECASLLSGPPPAEGTATWLALRDCCARHWREAIGRDDLARAVGISPTHVSRLFARHGTGLREHLTSIRLRHACDLLRDTDQDLAAIATRCAFANASHLLRSFRAAYGTTPGRWRRRPE